MTLTQPERIGSRANWTEIHQPAPVCRHTVRTAGTHAHSDLHECTCIEQTCTVMQMHSKRSNSTWTHATEALLYRIYSMCNDRLAYNNHLINSTPSQRGCPDKIPGFSLCMTKSGTPKPDHTYASAHTHTISQIDYSLMYSKYNYRHEHTYLTFLQSQI